MGMIRADQRGLSLIELIVFIVVLAVGMTGMLAVFNATVRASGDPLPQKQMLAIAEAMMEEILLKDFADPAGECTATTTPSCNANNVSDRQNYNDIGDYNGYNQPASYAIGDTAGLPSYPGLAGFNVNVIIDKTVALTNVPVGAIARITVTVSRGVDNLSLDGYRSSYGG